MQHEIDRLGPETSALEVGQVSASGQDLLGEGEDIGHSRVVRPGQRHGRGTEDGGEKGTGNSHGNDQV